MSVLLSYEYTGPQYPDTEEKRIEMIRRRGEELSPEMDWCQLLHQEHGVGGSLASARSIPGSYTDERDVRLPKNQIEISRTLAIEV
jgi:hypothetical protein